MDNTLIANCKIDIYKDNNQNISDYNIKDVDLIITSPPYDSARDYTGESGWDFDQFKKSADAITGTLKKGGILI